MEALVIAQNCVVMDKDVKPFEDQKGNKLEYYVMTFKQGDKWNVNVTVDKDVYPSIKVNSTADIVLEISLNQKNNYMHKFRVKEVRPVRSNMVESGKKE